MIALSHATLTCQFEIAILQAGLPSQEVPETYIIADALIFCTRVLLSSSFLALKRTIIYVLAMIRAIVSGEMGNSSKSA